jgi:DHA2 family multidrug resistance protein
MDTGLTHDWANDDFLWSQIVEAIGLAFGITALVTYAIANITPAQAPAMAAVIQTGRLFGNEVGSAFIQSFVRVREQVHSNLLGLHLSQGADLTDSTVAQLAGLFTDRPLGTGDVAGQSLDAIGNLVRREAYVLAYIDGFWTVAWVLALSLGLVLLLKPPPPNPLTPPRIRG